MQSRAEFLATLPRRRVVAASLIRNEGGEVCVVEPAYRDGWQLPGGMVETGESPRQACRREVAEELGLDTAPGRLLCITCVRPAWDDPDGAIVFVYDGGVLTPDQIAAVVLPPKELRAMHFLPTEGLEPCVRDTTVPRIHAAMEALEQGTVVELMG